MLSPGREDRLAGKRYQADGQGRKNVLAQFGKGVFVERQGILALEAEYALGNDADAWLTTDSEGIVWTHTQAETDGKTGLAMMIEEKKHFWKDAGEAPGMHYRILIENAGDYSVWLFMKFEDDDSDACVLAVDGAVQEPGQQFGPADGFFTYSMKQRWHWRALSKLELTAGLHVFSVLGRKSGLRIDRIYLTHGGEWPPIDGDWTESLREIRSEPS